MTIAVGQQQILSPRRTGQHLVSDRHGNRPLEHRLHVIIAVDNRMQGKVTSSVLYNEKSRMRVGDVIVPAFADRDSLE